jgi:hypothetical protein
VIHDPDIVNFTPGENEFMKSIEQCGDFVPLPPPNQAFSKKVSSQSGANTHSIDRSSQHIKLQQTLAKELEQKYSLMMKGVCDKDEQKEIERNAWESKEKEKEAVDKKNGVKLSYEDQKAREKESFKNK